MRDVAVLLATYNGRHWLPEQLDSILNQRDVAVRVIVSDDGSTDGTLEWLADRAAEDPRITILPKVEPTGSSAKNFYRLIADAETAAGELVAFADQDDLWMPDKLARHARLLEERAADGVSSNVTSFTPDGKRTLIRKDHAQRRLDYIFQGPGPGSTFLLSPALFALLKRLVREEPALVVAVEFHDLLIYAVARGAGLTWHIDSASTVDYRQHDANVIGANVGLASALERFRLIRSHWHRRQATAMTRVALAVASDRTRGDLTSVLRLLEGEALSDRWRLARLAPDLRRLPRDRWILAILIAIGVW